MQDSIRRINNQQYTRETGSLLISEPKLELSVKKDEVVTGSVEVSLQSGQDFTGYVYSSDYRMQCKRKKISGGKAMLSYQFDASGLECGDVRKGEICIVTGVGMFFLPFQAEVKRKTIQSSLGPIKNLFHFVNLAKTHWEEAVSIFYGDAFEDILVGADRQYLAAYIGLSKYKYNERNMDEFLLLTNKKQMQSFRLVEQEAVLDTSLQQMGGELCVERNGWGYTYVELSALGDFIRLDRKALTEEDFGGTRCNIPFGIREEKLHDGKNYGSIVLKSRESELTFPVTVIMTRPESRRSTYGKEERRLVLEMMQHYIRFRTRRLEREKWLEESEKSTQQVTNHHAGSMRARLYQAHILLLKDRPNEAKWILNHVAEQLEQGQGDDREYAYYLYLTYRYEQSDESAAKVRRELKRLYREHPHDFWFYWLLLETDEDLKADKENVYRELEALFKRGANSPVLYLEAYRILESEPKLFYRLGSFEVQVLRFAVKYNLLKEEMLDQIAYLSARTREREKDILPILEHGYVVFGGETILQAICSLLIQHACTDSRYFPYFKEAVEHGLRLTRLYEYYMLTLDPERKRPLPKEVLMFFSYECHLDYERKAYVLAGACRQKEEIASVFPAFEKQIPDFIKEQIRKNRMSDELAYLYENYLGTIEFDEELAAAFVKLAFKYKVAIGREDIRNVIVIHEQLKQERIYPVTGHAAYASVYTDDCCILLEDAEHNRYVPKEKLHLNPLLLYKKLFYLLENSELNHLGFLLYLCEDKKAYSMIDGENVGAFTCLLLSSEVADAYKQQFGKRLLRYYFENDYMDGLKDLIEKLNYSNVAVQDRDDVVRYMLILRRYDLAYDFVMTYGFEYLSPKTLAKVCVHRLASTQGLSVQVLWLCYEVFLKGKADEQILSYLVEHFDGTMRQMKDIWMQAKEKKVDTLKIERRILTQLLFCEGYLAQKEDIFESYARNAAGVDDLVRAYVAKSCYDYFVHDYLIGEKLFAEVLRIARAGEPLVLVCKMAFLKFYAGRKDGNESVSDEEREIIIAFVRELMEQKYYFSFMQVFKDWVPEMLPDMERSYVEYRTQPGAKVTIHYLMAKDGKAIGDYEKETMQELFDGFYSKSFCLFFSRQLQYYITVEQDGRESFVESGELENLDVTNMHKETRFSILNDIVISTALQDQDTTVQLMREYAQQVWMTEELLKLK